MTVFELDFKDYCILDGFTFDVNSDSLSDALSNGTVVPVEVYEKMKKQGYQSVCNGTGFFLTRYEWESLRKSVKIPKSYQKLDSRKHAEIIRCIVPLIDARQL